MTFCSSNQRLVVWVKVGNVLSLWKWNFKSAWSLEMEKASCLGNLKCHQHYFQDRLLWRAFGNLKLVSRLYIKGGEKYFGLQDLLKYKCVFSIPSDNIKISHHCSSFNSGISRMHAVWSLQWSAFITGIIVVLEPECRKVISILYHEVL